MATFADTTTYTFSLKSTDEGVVLSSRYPVVSELLDFETLNYYFEHYTLQKGIFLNGFRKINMNDGSIGYFGKEHPEYKEALKEETISIRDISEGDTFLFDRYGQPTLVFLGSFYVKNYVRTDFRKRKHIFMDILTGSIYELNNAKKMLSAVGYSDIHRNKLSNYNNILNVNGNRNRYYFSEKGD